MFSFSGGVRLAITCSLNNFMSLCLHGMSVQSCFFFISAILILYKKG
jgi:hypothetical protein